MEIMDVKNDAEHQVGHVLPPAARCLLKPLQRFLYITSTSALWVLNWIRRGF